MDAAPLRTSPPHPAGDNRRMIDWRYAIFVWLHLAGFLASTLLITWGLFVLFFLAISGMSLDGLMHQLANLAGRYVAADGERVAAFKQILLPAHLLLTAAVIFFRRQHLLPRNHRRSDQHD